MTMIGWKDESNTQTHTNKRKTTLRRSELIRKKEKIPSHDIAHNGMRFTTTTKTKQKTLNEIKIIKSKCNCYLYLHTVIITEPVAV